MAIKKIETETLRQKVYNQLRQQILGAEILPGQVVSLRGLAEQFGVSLLPVREAVWQLESEKILVVKSNKRIEVNKLTRSEFEEVLNLRLLLESTAVEQACQIRPDSAVVKIERILEAMDKHVGKNHKAYIRKNDQFHQTIYAYAHSPLLLELIQRLLARVNPYIYLYAIHGRDLSSACECHHQIFAGFKKGDHELATAALRRDLEAAAKVILPNLEGQPLETAAETDVG
jgi:DNA-binding GntR family transcriptional regulator